MQRLLAAWIFGFGAIAGCGDDGNGDDGDIGTDADADSDADTDADTDTDTGSESDTGPDSWDACEGLSEDADAIGEAQDFFELLNAAREAGYTCTGGKMPPVPALAIDHAIRCASLEHVIYIEGIGVAQHAGPGGEDYEDRFRAWKYYPTRFGGDVLADEPTAQDAFDTWMARPHCADLAMDGEYEDFGVATLNGYWVAGYAAR